MIKVLIYFLIELTQYQGTSIDQLLWWREVYLLTNHIMSLLPCLSIQLILILTMVITIIAAHINYIDGSLGHRPLVI